MKRSHLLYTVTLIAFIANHSTGAVFERDWKSPGDGLLTFDDVSKREWLDLPLQFNLPTPRYDSVVAELGPGGLFEGFVVANRNDVVDLAESAGITIATTDFEVNSTPVNHIIDLLGAIGSSDIGFRRSIGQVAETFPFQPSPAQVAVDISISPLSRRAGLTILAARSDGFPSPNLPVFLHRDAVPEPGVMLSIISAMALFVLLSRKRPQSARMVIINH